MNKPMDGGGLTIVDPMGADEKRAEAIRKIQEAKRSLKDKKLEIKLSKREARRSTKTMDFHEVCEDSLEKFNADFFGEYQSLCSEEEHAAFESMFYAKAIRYVLGALIGLPVLAKGILYLAGHFSLLWAFAFVPFAALAAKTFISEYCPRYQNRHIWFDHHFRFLYAKFRLKMLGAK